MGFKSLAQTRPTAKCRLARTLGVRIRTLPVPGDSKTTAMKLRTVKIFSGLQFQVPEHIQRIDTRNTHGWQLRYGRAAEEPTKMFSDFTNDGSGAEQALELAIAELNTRIGQISAPSGLRFNPNSNKTSDLPAGVSGPTLRSANKPGRTPYYSYQVSVPRFGKSSTTKSFYIGTVNTADEKRSDVALLRAIEFRDAAAISYETAKTNAKRQTVSKNRSASKSTDA